MENVRRIFVEKRPGFDVEAQGLCADLNETLGIKGLTGARVFKRYDVSGLSDAEYERAVSAVFSEPNCDEVYFETLPEVRGQVFAVEYLPGQYDQRADSAAQCIQLFTQGERPQVKTATVYVLEGDLDGETVARIKHYIINPVESREASLEKPETLKMSVNVPEDVKTVTGFTTLSFEEVSRMVRDLGMAMTPSDLQFCQAYFRDEEKRDPSLTELRAIDTYWSDHCRHTTFLTSIDQVTFDTDPLCAPIAQAYGDYLKCRDKVYAGRQRDVTLMDMAVIGMKELRRRGKLHDLDQSEEINACSIIVTATVDGVEEEWLIQFKNETHNHPTEIEPFGGAATCLGGAIRDPLSGRAYVYQAMRITGAADPRVPVSETLPGKLPQRKLTRTAAAGFSSYGNQIGLAAGKVQEVYHPGFVAKRLETGAVIAAVPRKNVVREAPEPGDLVILLGGRTGRDGCGGATGSSKAHTEESLSTCGAEVQKGNPPTERHIQRLFRNDEFARMIKRCNDFGAGGVSVAIGELAPGLTINLDAVPRKYEGLDGTELAISESQERMACVISPENKDRFIEIAQSENLEATLVAQVDAEPRLKMIWRGKTLVDLSRAFLDTNGVTQHAQAHVTAPKAEEDFFTRTPQALLDSKNLPEAWMRNLQDLNVCSQKGLVERFDGSIGASTVIAPYGGKTRLTPNEAMAAKLPVLGKTDFCTLMSHGYNPYLSSWSPFHGAVYAVVESLAKIAAAGGDSSKARLTFQEYFERMTEDATRWGKPLAALLGGLAAQLGMGVASIGGKDSMSGSFDDIDVPPTLISFAVATGDAKKLISPELKAAGHKLAMIEVARDEREMPDFETLLRKYAALHEWIQEGKVISAATVGQGGAAAAISKMCFGNLIGVQLREISVKALFSPNYGSIILELADGVDSLPGTRAIGETIAQSEIRVEEEVILLEDAIASWTAPLEPIFPTVPRQAAPEAGFVPYRAESRVKPSVHVARPQVLIPVFPGTNCEYDTEKAFEMAGARVKTVLIRNLNPEAIEQSVAEIVNAIKGSQIVAFPGGFSGGDEPDGSAKFIVSTFRNPRIAEAMQELLETRDGLVLGICNGFQALIKLGLVPYGKIKPKLDVSDPTLTFNTIGRHVATTVDTVVTSNKSPWMMYTEPGEVHAIAISHGEGRFVASEEQVKALLANGQVATQYAGPDGKPAQCAPYNPNGSVWAIEGITSPDGRVLGKMGHSERSVDTQIAINIPGNKDQKLFQAGVDYFAR